MGGVRDGVNRAFIMRAQPALAVPRGVCPRGYVLPLEALPPDLRQRAQAPCAPKGYLETLRALPLRDRAGEKCLVLMNSHS